MTEKSDRIKIVELSKTMGESFKNLLATPHPKRVEIGQIWSTNSTSELSRGQTVSTSKPRLVFILETLSGDSNTIIAAPVSTEIFHAAQYDLILRGENSPVGFDIMIEVWNMVTVFDDHLKQCFGTLTNEIKSILQQIYHLQIQNKPIPSSLQDWVGLPIMGENDVRLKFQEREVDAISYLALSSTHALHESLSEATEKDWKKEIFADLIYKIRPEYAKRSDYINSQSFAFAAADQEAKSYFICERDETRHLSFNIELFRDPAPSFTIRLLVHSLSENLFGKTCQITLDTGEEQYRFEKFSLHPDVEAETQGDPMFHASKILSTIVEISE